MTITEPTCLMLGLTARRLSTGFVAVDLGYQADPTVFTPEVIAAERAGLPGWRWRKEYERDFGAQAGQPVFDPERLSRQQPHLREPLYRLDLDATGKLVRYPKGRLLVFLEPNAQPRSNLPVGVVGVLRQCGIGIDVSEGVGESDSVIQVFFADNGEQAAELADNRITPSDLGRFAVAVARRYNEALVCCVRKMHGITTIRVMRDEGKYPYVWHHKTPDRMTQLATERLGWAKGESSDELLFGTWTDAVDKGQAILHSLACYQQHQQYIYDENGRIVLQALASLPVEVRERHGDRVIGCALAKRACMDLPAFKAVIRRQRTLAEIEMERRATARSGVWR